MGKWSAVYIPTTLRRWMGFTLLHINGANLDPFKVLFEGENRGAKRIYFFVN